MKRPCIRCGTPAPDGRCPSCGYGTHKSSSTQRGYGTAHRNARTQLIANLPTPCAYGCGQLLTKPTELIAAHLRDGKGGAWVAACRSCNERAKRSNTIGKPTR